MVSRGHQGLVTYVQTELGSSRPCQTPEGTSCGTEKKVGVGKERREAQAGPGEKSRKAQESLARSSAPSPSFHALHLVQGRSMLEGTAPALHVHSVPREKQLPRTSVTLEAAWPRPPAPSCTLDPDTLAGRGGVAWQPGSDGIGRARSRDLAPGSGALGPAPAEAEVEPPATARFPAAP